MSTFTQYHDHNFYFKSTKVNNHVRLNNDDIENLLADHDHSAEILDICNSIYRPDDLPSNGSEFGCVTGKVTHNTDTRDLAEQARQPVVYWERMMLGYQANIRKLARWANGYNPETKDTLRFNAKLAKTRAEMKHNPKLAKSLSKRWELLKMCNPAL